MKYPQLVRFVRETPWAILPTTFAAISEMIALRSQGKEFTPEEIQARIGVTTPTEENAVGTVAIINLYGVIVPRADIFSMISGATSLERFSRVFAAAIESDEIDGILLNVDSPGGSTYLVPETAKLIYDARGTKPIWAIANTQANSAAYYLASQADEFVASPSALVGSIGVFAAHEDISQMEEMVGVKTTLISSTPEKVELSPFAPLSDDARASLQTRIDDIYAGFVTDVARGRGVSEATVLADFGQGRVLTADKALEAGMIDRIATFEETAAALVQQVTKARASGLGQRPFPTSTPFSQSFADTLDAALAAVERVITDTESLADTRRGRMTAAKREQITSLHDRLGALLIQTTPHANTILNEAVRFESLRANL